MIKKAFTMTEALIIIGIIGVIAALSIVAVNTAKPDKDIIMFRRAYSETQKVIKELLTDKELYPNAEVIALNLNISKLKSMAVTQTCSQKYHKLECSAEMFELSVQDQWYDDYNNYCKEQQVEYQTRCEGGGGSTTSSSSSSLSGLGDVTISCKATVSEINACISQGNTWSDRMCTCLSKIDPITSSSSSSSSSSSGLVGSSSSGLVGSSGAGISSSLIGACLYMDKMNCQNKGGTWNSTTCKCKMPSGDEFDFEDSQISVLGKGFADTEITEEQYNKNPFLRLAGVGPQNKFAVSFANRLNTISNPIISGNTVQFGTPDGLYWVVEDHFNDTTKYALINVYMAKISPSSSETYINNQLAKTCSYSDSCKAPTKFTLKVEPSGKVNLVDASNTNNIDPMACSYMRYPRINKRSKIPTDINVNTCFRQYRIQNPKCEVNAHGIQVCEAVARELE